MNLLYLSNEYPPETGLGGIGTYTNYCAEGMAARGHAVYVICRSRSGEEQVTTNCGVTLFRTPPGSYPLPGHRLFFPLRKFCYHSIPESLVRLAWAKQAYQTYKKELSGKTVIDIVEYPECGGEGFYFARDKNLLKVARLHTPWAMVRKLDRISHHPLDECLLDHIERSAVGNASFVTAPSHALAAIMKKRWKLPQVTVIPNPIPHAGFPPSKGNDLLFLGRIEFRKGVHILIEAYSRLCKHLTPPPLRLVGAPYGRLPDGADYGDRISRLIAEIPHNGSVEWIRGVSRSGVAEYMGRSSVAIFPSLWENMSYACLEAMASGLAVVASNCGGFPEIISHGENGMLVEPQNPESLMNAMKELITAPHLVSTLGDNARRSVRMRFSLETVCARLESLYRDFLWRRVHEPQ
jgi:glycosyltransferase involved in cell wall biosynthesis